MNMKKILMSALVFLLLTPFLRGVLAYEKLSGESAKITVESNTGKTAGQTNILLIKKTVIKKILNKYNSPLAASTDGFIDACVTYELDCYLLPSIAGLESTFGKFIYPQSYNPFGWARGYMMFSRWEEGIQTVAKGLRERYVNRGAQTTAQIGRIYSESPTWANRVDFLKKQFYNEEEKMQNINFAL